MSEPTKDRVTEAVREAEFAFWAVIVQAFPEIKRGEVSPWEAMLFESELEDAVRRWYNDNKDEPEHL
tara:strand:- start:569 stop:769 length:201 start_codon:yes stop_codon:yes gene_type:complete